MRYQCANVVTMVSDKSLIVFVVVFVSSFSTSWGLVVPFFATSDSVGRSGGGRRRRRALSGSVNYHHKAVSRVSRRVMTLSSVRESINDRSTGIVDERISETGTTESFNSVAATTTSVASPVLSSKIPIPNEQRIEGKSSTTITTKQIYGIRHGISMSNEWMTGPNTWGCPTYNDTLNIPDSPLSTRGIQQAQQLSQQLLLPQRKSDNINQLDNHDNNNDNENWLQHIQLIVVSPLTRCLQTYQYAIRPIVFNEQQQQPHQIPVVVVVHPLLAERLYSRSETGRPASVLQQDFPFPELDWDVLLKHQQNDCWWYNPTTTTSIPEWRPHGQGQYYGSTIGEPLDVFTQRMEKMQDWLLHRPETNILTIGHWGVYRHFTGGQLELENCQVCNFELSFKNLSKADCNGEHQQLYSSL